MKIPSAFFHQGQYEVGTQKIAAGQMTRRQRIGGREGRGEGHRRALVLRKLICGTGLASIRASISVNSSRER